MNFVQIIVQEKSRNEDYRAFCICEDEEGIQWELRSAGYDTPAKAVEEVFKYFNDRESWCHVGYELGMSGWRDNDVNLETIMWMPDLTYYDKIVAIEYNDDGGVEKLIKDCWHKKELRNVPRLISGQMAIVPKDALKFILLSNANIIELRHVGHCKQEVVKEIIRRCNNDEEPSYYCCDDCVYRSFVKLETVKEIEKDLVKEIEKDLANGS